MPPFPRGLATNPPIVSGAKMQWKAKTKMAKDRTHSASKPRSHQRPPKKNAWSGRKKKLMEKILLILEANRFRNYPKWLSISARLSTKPCYRRIFFGKKENLENAVCLCSKDSLSIFTNHSLSISRNTLVGFIHPSSWISLHPKSLAICLPRNDAWRGLGSLLNRCQPCQRDASKESPYDQTPKASIPWEETAQQWMWMKYVSVSLKMATARTFNIHETSVH